MLNNATHFYQWPLRHLNYLTHLLSNYSGAASKHVVLAIARQLWLKVFNISNHALSGWLIRIEATVRLKTKLMYRYSRMEILYELYRTSLIRQIGTIEIIRDIIP